MSIKPQDVSGPSPTAEEAIDLVWVCKDECRGIVTDNTHLIAIAIAEHVRPEADATLTLENGSPWNLSCIAFSQMATMVAISLGLPARMISVFCRNWRHLPHVYGFQSSGEVSEDGWAGHAVTLVGTAPYQVLVDLTIEQVNGNREKASTMTAP